MRARFLSWWQKIKQQPVRAAIIIGVGALGIVLLVAFIGGYFFHWDWTGFGSYTPPTKDSNFQRGKTLWDWLQLLIIPLALAVIALVFQLANTRTERQIAKQRYEQDQQIAAQRYEQDQNLALDKQREDLLHIYLDRMSELLLDKQLRTSEPDTEVRNVARVRTLTMLYQLDTRRNNYLFTFLRESGLATADPNTSIVSLSKAVLRNIDLHNVDLHAVELGGADLSGADLSGADLSEVNLSKANLSEAILKEADLSKAFLQEANLSNTDLSNTDLGEANLGNASLMAANLSEAFLNRADLSEALLYEANLSKAFLQEADLSGADLSLANLSGAVIVIHGIIPKGPGFIELHDHNYNHHIDGANLGEANLSYANLSGAKVTEEQLKQAKSLKGATMPDGSIHP